MFGRFYSPDRVEHAELYCGEKCKAEGFCCNDPNVGSHQLLSCAQACMIRARGSDADICGQACDAQALPRPGQGGCSRTVGGHRYSMCARCSDAGGSCVHNKDTCRAGCAMAGLQPSSSVSPPSVSWAWPPCASCELVPCGECQEGCPAKWCSAAKTGSANWCANGNRGKQPTFCENNPFGMLVG